VLDFHRRLRALCSHRHAGIVDHNVNATKRFQRVVVSALQQVQLAEVAGDDDDLGFIGSGQLLGQLLQLRLGSRCDDELRTNVQRGNVLGQRHSNA
jgi:hypothetical protein